MSGLELTGERTLPGIPSENYWFRRHLAAYRFAASQVAGLVIDAGCGEGYGAGLLARWVRVVGLDLDAATVVHARSRYRAPSFVRADLERLPIRPRSADAIVAFQVLEHLRAPESFLEACARTLRPGGRLILSTPNRSRFPAGLNPFHTHEYDADELGTILGRSFGEVRLLGVQHGPALRLLDPRLGGSVQQRLVEASYEGLPSWARSALRMVRAGSFRITRDPADGLDLLAVCRSIET